MTSFALISDLHLEFREYNQAFPKADALLVAGDTYAKSSYNAIGNYKSFMTRARSIYGDNIIEIEGNHTGYGGSITDFAHLQIVRTVGDVVVIACTLWSGEGSQFAYTSLNDSRVIKGFTWDWMHDRHLSDLEFIKKNLEDNRGRKTVVLTHHLPHFECVHDKYKNDGLINLGFYTDLDSIIREYEPTVWCNGHTHNSYDFVLPETNTRMLCNPRGYPVKIGGVISNENRGFNPLFTFEV